MELFWSSTIAVNLLQAEIRIFAPMATHAGSEDISKELRQLQRWRAGAEIDLIGKTHIGSVSSPQHATKAFYVPQLWSREGAAGFSALKLGQFLCNI